MAYEYEWEDMPEAPGETATQRSGRGSFYATLKRINQSREFFERAWKLQPRCMAVLGPKVEETFLLMHRARREIEVAAQMLGSGRRSLGHELRSQLERDVWDIGSVEPEKDRVGQKLSQFRTQSEAICRPVIERQLRSFRLSPWNRGNKKALQGPPSGTAAPS